MYSKSAILMIFALVSMLLLPLAAANAESWSFSPYRAQLSVEDEAEQVTDEAVVPAGHPDKKNVGRGVMFSLVIPGAGQLYSGSWLRAVPWFAVEIGAWVLFSSYNADGNDKTDEFEAYAGPHKNNDPTAGHFNYDAYMMREYQIASNPSLNELQAVYDGGFDAWKNDTWEERGSYLPPPFGHNINITDIQQYYEMIGKYYTQFGYGWIDTYSWDGPITADHGDIWSATSGDDAATIGFDGNSPFFYTYRDMRGEANDALENANVMMEIVLANHVLSALDAAFAVRGYNKKLEESPLGDLRFRFNTKQYDGQIARMLTMSFPLDRK